MRNWEFGGYGFGGVRDRTLKLCPVLFNFNIVHKSMNKRLSTMSLALSQF